MISKRYKDDGKTCLRLSASEKSALKVHFDKLAYRHYEFEDRACPVCGKSSGEVIAEKDRYGIPLRVVVCPDCGLIRTNPRMNQDSYSEFYGEEYRMLYSGKSEPDEEFFHDQVNHGLAIQAYLVKNGFTVRAGELVVEVGCGSGGILSVFQASGAKVLGCDLGEGFLRFGRERHDLDLRHGVLRDLVLTGKAKLVIYSHVLEHLLCVKSELDYLRSILADDGVVYIEVPSVKNIHGGGYRGDFLQLLQNAHTYHFTGRSLVNLMLVNGYRALCFDELVRGVFQADVPRPWKSDYRDVVNFLHRAEYTRHLYFIRPATLLRGMKALVPRRLKKAIKSSIARLRLV
jgi:SAM-dependent methyltransferase